MASSHACVQSQKGLTTLACLNEMLFLGQMMLIDGSQHGRIRSLQLARGIARLGVWALRQQGPSCTQPLLFCWQAYCLTQSAEGLVWLLDD